MEKRVQIAKVAGIYTCLGLGETLFREAGQELPPCGCSGKAWELRKEDNLVPMNAITVFVIKGGVSYFIATDTTEVFEEGALLNLRGPGPNLEEGTYRVILFDDNFKYRGKSYFMVEVEHVGELSDDLMIHMAEWVIM